MTGLEKIVEQIEQEAKAVSEEKLAETRKEAQQILAESKVKRESSYEAAIKTLDADAKQLLLRGQSAASLKERKLLLEAKQQIIQQIFDESAESIRNLSTEDYFAFLLRMVDRYARDEDGTMSLSRQDLDRMPETFVKELTNRKITIMKEPARVNGGFLLSYGETEENCSLEELLSANREKLQDQIVKLIFE